MIDWCTYFYLIPCVWKLHFNSDCNNMRRFLSIFINTTPFYCLLYNLKINLKPKKYSKIHFFAKFIYGHKLAQKIRNRYKHLVKASSHKLSTQVIFIKYPVNLMRCKDIKKMSMTKECAMCDKQKVCR